jgi:hypothetical protein
MHSRGSPLACSAACCKFLIEADRVFCCRMACWHLLWHQLTCTKVLRSPPGLHCWFHGCMELQELAMIRTPTHRRRPLANSGEEEGSNNNSSSKAAQLWPAWIRAVQRSKQRSSQKWWQFASG